MTDSERPSWDEVWMHVAGELGKRSRCDRRQVGAVIVDTQNRPIAVGYNGPPAGMTDLEGNCSNWCPRALLGDGAPAAYDTCYTVHAEMNALMFADRRDYAGGTIYVTSVCCWDCGKAVANSGVGTVVLYLDTERDGHRNPTRTIEMLESSGVTVVVMNERK